MTIRIAFTDSTGQRCDLMAGWNDGTVSHARPSTPSDLAAALAAMPEGERAEVLAAFHGDSIVHRHLQERVEAAERERDRMAREFGTCPGELPDDGEIARVVRERAEFRASAEKAEAVLDEWSRLDGHSPGVTADKAREYGRIAAEQKTLAEAAEREVTRLRIDAAQRDRDWTVIRTLTDAPYGPATTVEAVRRVVSERDSLLESVAAREKERDAEAKQAHEARCEVERLLGTNARYSAAADEALRDRDEARLDLDRAQAALAVVRHDLEGTRRDLGDLRTRLIAAETAAAQREPREYPLAEGSPLPTIDPERLDLVRRALSGYVDTDQSPEQAARVAVEVADAALSVMRGLL